MIPTPIKRRRLLDWIFKKRQNIILLETHFKYNYNDSNKLKVKGWNRIYNMNANQKKAGRIIIFLIN